MAHWLSEKYDVFAGQPRACVQVSLYSANDVEPGVTIHADDDFGAHETREIVVALPVHTGGEQLAPAFFDHLGRTEERQNFADWFHQRTIAIHDRSIN